MPAKVPPLAPEGGFHLPEHLLDYKPSAVGEEIWTATLGPFKQLVEENIGLMVAVVGLVICIMVGKFVIGWLSGRGTPEALTPLPGNTEHVYHTSGSQGTLF